MKAIEMNGIVKPLEINEIQSYNNNKQEKNTKFRCWHIWFGMRNLILFKCRKNNIQTHICRIHMLTQNLRIFILIAPLSLLM